MVWVAWRKKNMHNTNSGAGQRLYLGINTSWCYYKKHTRAERNSCDIPFPVDCAHAVQLNPVQQSSHPLRHRQPRIRMSILAVSFKTSKEKTSVKMLLMLGVFVFSLTYLWEQQCLPPARRARCIAQMTAWQTYCTAWWHQWCHDPAPKCPSWDAVPGECLNQCQQTPSCLAAVWGRQGGTITVFIQSLRLLTTLTQCTCSILQWGWYCNKLFAFPNSTVSMDTKQQKTHSAF